MLNQLPKVGKHNFKRFVTKSLERTQPEKGYCADI